MPDFNEANIRHLLKRTEFVDRSSRVADLMVLGSIASAVDNVMQAEPSPVSAPQPVGDADRYVHAQDLVDFWLDRMAHHAERPLAEKMALFWHGHFVVEFEKTGPARNIVSYVDLLRREALGNIVTIAKSVSTEIAMLRFLDNDQNQASSPNQNFARELIELFLLGAGNYSEADVEAASAAWTGHRVAIPGYVYSFAPELHDAGAKEFLGVAINDSPDLTSHGIETIDVVFGGGVVPVSASVIANRGRPTRDVAAEFLSRKLWLDFANDHPSVEVIAQMSAALVDNNFAIRPWVRTMLLADEFYAESTKTGLVRPPVDWIVLMLYATGHESAGTTPHWLLPTMGQKPLFPPNVSGWGTNGYWVNATAMESRALAAQNFAWRSLRDYNKPDLSGYVRLGQGQLTWAEITDQATDGTPALSNEAFVDRILDLLDIRLESKTHQRVVDFVAADDVWQRISVLAFILMVPELHLS